MKTNQNKAGFTLIELLVVVLIIGILAAVALPQYQLVVTRTHLVQLKAVAESIAQAQELYYLENNAYATKFSELDISLPGGGTPNEADTQVEYNDWKCNLDTYNSQCTHTSGMRIAYLVYHQHWTGSPADSYLAGQRLCQANTKNSVADKVCKLDTQKKTGLNWSVPSYIY